MACRVVRRALCVNGARGVVCNAVCGVCVCVCGHGVCLTRGVVRCVVGCGVVLPVGAIVGCGVVCGWVCDLVLRVVCGAVCGVRRWCAACGVWRGVRVVRGWRVMWCARLIMASCVALCLVWCVLRCVVWFGAACCVVARGVGHSRFGCGVPCGRVCVRGAVRDSCGVVLFHAGDGSTTNRRRRWVGGGVWQI